MANKKNKRVSLKDIADNVGVSTALVSYVLNGQEKEKRVGAEVVKKIRKALQEMNYKPNLIARSLRYGKTQTIGLIVTDIANPFFSSMARYIEDEASKYGYTVIIGSSDENYEKSDILVNTLLNRQVDGFIIVPADGGFGYLKNLVEDNVPLVMVDRYIPEVPSSYVVLDNFTASYDATIHLINKGYTHVGLIAYKFSLNHMKDRIRGYEEAMKTKGLEKNIWTKLIRFNHIKSDIDKAIEAVKKKEVDKIDALFFATNSLSLAGLYKIHEIKLKVPGDVAIIGFDGHEAFDFFNPPLSYVKQPVDEMGKEAVRILIDQIKGSKKMSHIHLLPQLIIRNSD
jgi:LacI family transcriptional regulator